MAIGVCNSCEITEINGRPDTMVEAGALLAKIVDFRKALVRVDVPFGFLHEPPPRLDFSVLPATPPAFEASAPPRSCRGSAGLEELARKGPAKVADRPLLAG